MLVVYFLTLVGLVLGRESQHADLVKELVLSGEGARFSNDVIEDALLDVPDLIKKYGYPVEVHEVETRDGYILELHRIPHGQNPKQSPRQVVFLNHGMFGSSADWVISGPGNALAYVLADAGFDVWMGNARGTYYSRRHTTLDPDTDTAYWRFSWDEIGNIDLPASVDKALEVSGKDGLHFIAHSQGGTTFFVMTTLNRSYNDKIYSFQAFAPAVFNTALDRPLLEIAAPYLGLVERILARFGIAELFPNSQFITDIGVNYCSSGITQGLCSVAFHLFGGYSPEMHNATMMPLILGHTPAGASFRQIAHFGQVITTNLFRRYDYGTSLQNILAYGRPTPPEYDLNRATVPVYIYYGEGDQSVSTVDLFYLADQLPNVKAMLRIDHPTFNHIDFLYGNGAKRLL